MCRAPPPVICFRAPHHTDPMKLVRYPHTAHTRTRVARGNAARSPATSTTLITHRPCRGCRRCHRCCANARAGFNANSRLDCAVAPATVAVAREANLVRDDDRRVPVACAGRRGQCGAHAGAGHRLRRRDADRQPRGPHAARDPHAAAGGCRRVGGHARDAAAAPPPRRAAVGAAVAPRAQPAHGDPEAARARAGGAQRRRRERRGHARHLRPGRRARGGVRRARRAARARCPARAPPSPG